MFGAFTIAEASEAFQWLFVIFSTLQGVFLFFYFCVLATDAREEWLKLLRCYAKRPDTLSHTSQANFRSRDHKHSSTYLKASKDYSSSTLKRNVLSPNTSSSQLTSGRHNSFGEGQTSALEMSRMKNLLLALPQKPSIVEEKETELVIGNDNVSDFNLTDSCEPDDVFDEVDESDDCTTITNTTAVEPMVEVPPHIIERRFLYRQKPPIHQEMEKETDTFTDDTTDFCSDDRSEEPIVEVPPHILQRRLCHPRAPKPEIRLTQKEEDEEDDFRGPMSDSFNDYDLDFDDIAQLLDLSQFTDEYISEFEETSQL